MWQLDASQVCISKTTLTILLLYVQTYSFRFCRQAVEYYHFLYGTLFMSNTEAKTRNPSQMLLILTKAVTLVLIIDIFYYPIIIWSIT